MFQLHKISHGLLGCDVYNKSQYSLNTKFLVSSSNYFSGMDSSTGLGQHISIIESPNVGEMLGNTQQLHSQTKQVVLNIYDYFRSRNHLLSKTDLQIKVAAATGISVHSVQQIRKQAKDGRLYSPPPVRNRQSPEKDSIE